MFVLAKEAYEYLKGAKEVFDVGKGALDAAKDIKEHFEIKEGEPKLVDFEWTRKSGFQEQAEAQGYKIAFSRPRQDREPRDRRLRGHVRDRQGSKDQAQARAARRPDADRQEKLITNERALACRTRQGKVNFCCCDSERRSQRLSNKVVLFSTVLTLSA